MIEKTQNAISAPLAHPEGSQRPAIDRKEDWQSEFIAWLAEERSETTVAAYAGDLAHFCAWFERANGQAFAPALMNSMDARAYREWSLEVERCAPATWNRRRATLAVLCRWIEEELHIQLYRLERKIKAAPEQEQAPRWLSQAEERALMRQLEIDVTAASTALRRRRAVRDRALVALMRYAGLRVQEAARLAMGDLELSERKGSLTVRLGKREKKRVVPLSVSAREALGAWLEEKKNSPANGANSLFVDEQGRALSARAIQKRVEGLAAQLHVPGLTCHALRHTCAKAMLDAGRPLSEVQQILGHEKLETTARYVQPGREDLQEAVEAGELGRLRKGK